MNATGVARPIRVLLADDHDLVRRGLKLLLESDPGIRVSSEAADGAEAVRRALADDVDVAVLDLSMPGMSGIQAARELRRLRPGIRVILLSMHTDEQFHVEAIRAGAAAYVRKSDGGQTLIDACRAAVTGPSPRPGRPAPPRHTVERERAAAGVHLTAREAQVLGLIADGHTTKEIAAVLQLSPRTVDRHRDNLLHKLGLRNRVELTRFALREAVTVPAPADQEGRPPAP
jgi:DNA-binding NarL/FixJ family response regulator